MKVKVRKFGGEGYEMFEDIVTVQTGKKGIIVWVSEKTFDADLTVTINSNDHIEGPDALHTLWVRGKDD